jgi:hypothetical protein
MVSGGMIYIPSLITIGSGIRVKLRVSSQKFETVMLVLLIRGIYKLRRLDGLRWRDLHTKFHKYWFRHSKVVRGDTHTDTNSMVIS